MWKIDGGATARSWTDEIFALFVSGRFGELNAGDVCRAIDWIESQPSLLDRIHGAELAERESWLARLVRASARQALPQRFPAPRFELPVTIARPPARAGLRVGSQLAAAARSKRRPA